MPPLPFVPQVIKLTMGGTYHDTQWLNTYHVKYSGGRPSSANLLAYITSVSGNANSAYGAEMSVDNEITTFTAIDLTDDLGAEASYTESHFGTRTGDFNPANVAVCMSLHIGRRYRGGHPRKYLSWGTSGTFATGSTKDWDPAFITDCELRFNDMLAGMASYTEGTTNFDTNVSVSYRNAGATRVTAIVDPIIGVVMAPRVCSQRRRLGKVGG